jgi:sulfopyruvate decarboxylase alpha subunit
LASAHGCSSRKPAICPGEAEIRPLWKKQGAKHLAQISDREPQPWQDQLFDTLKRADIRQVGYVPDAGHSRLIARCKADPDIRDVVLTTEEEGVAMAAGAWLGGQRSALLMQSSGVGNCINMLSLIRACRFPMLMIVTMRGEWEEFNPWQEPMGSIVDPVLKLCDTDVAKVETPDAVVPAVQNAVQLAFGNDRAAAVLLSQKLIGRKVWVK